MNCYSCKHRREVPGICHSSCAAIPVSVQPSVFMVVQVMGQLKTNDVDVQFIAHGIKNGWCDWPLNFDPTWVESCNLYEVL